MKLMNLSHVSVTPFLACNFNCPYCISNSRNDLFGTWESNYKEVEMFIGTLPKKMLFISGGEPLLWHRWPDLIKRTNHYWYFLTNTSIIPNWLRDNEIKEKVKLFISTFHRDCIQIQRYIDNINRIRELGYPVFSKIVYTKNRKQINDAEQIIKNKIPVSFAPLVDTTYDTGEILEILPYCQSKMYLRRFYGSHRKPGKCIAGTKDSFQIDGNILTRCDHYSSMKLNSIPKLLRKLYSGYIGDMTNPTPYSRPVSCNKKECFCENLHFNEILDDSENSKWQNLIETGKW